MKRHVIINRGVNAGRTEVIRLAQLSREDLAKQFAALRIKLFPWQIAALEAVMRGDSVTLL